MKKNKGFTLIELLVVTTIIIILSSIGLVSFVNAGKSARDSKRKADLETVRQALVLYKSNATNGLYPDVLTYGAVITALTTSPSYLSEPTPVDPKPPAVYSYESISSGASFCLCAGMEKTSNASPLAGCNSGLTNPYCVANP